MCLENDPFRDKLRQMNEKPLKRIFVANQIGLFLTCLITFILTIQIPETSLKNREQQFSEAVKKHLSDDALKEESVSLLRSIDYTQSQSRGLFKIVLLFNLFVIILLGINLFVLRKIKKTKTIIK